MHDIVSKESSRFTERFAHLAGGRRRFHPRYHFVPAGSGGAAGSALLSLGYREAVAGTALIDYGAEATIFDSFVEVENPSLPTFTPADRCGVTCRLRVPRHGRCLSVVSGCGHHRPARPP